MRIQTPYWTVAHQNYLHAPPNDEVIWYILFTYLLGYSNAYVTLDDVFDPIHESRDGHILLNKGTMVAGRTESYVRLNPMCV